MIDAIRKFTILSLDGGGTRGLLSANILKNIESYLNHKNTVHQNIGQRFDLITGTSTGGIIALALAAGKSASDIARFYEDNIPLIFNRPSKWSNLRWFLKPKYGPAAFSSCLATFFEENTLQDVLTDICITSVSLQNAKPRLYKSGYLARNLSRLDEKLADIAIATSAAPTYFRAHSLKHSSNLIDGGMCANNPSMIALVEGLQFERESKRGTPGANNVVDIVLLSIGTGEQCSMPYNADDLASGGLFDWIRFPFGDVPMLEVLFQSQADLVHFQTQFMLGDRYLRINPLLKFPMKLDDVTHVSELKNLADMTSEMERFINLYF